MTGRESLRSQPVGHPLAGCLQIAANRVEHWQQQIHHANPERGDSKRRPQTDCFRQQIAEQYNDGEDRQFPRPEGNPKARDVLKEEQAENDQGKVDAGITQQQHAQKSARILQESLHLRGEHRPFLL